MDDNTDAQVINDTDGGNQVTTTNVVVNVNFSLFNFWFAPWLGWSK